MEPTEEDRAMMESHTAGPGNAASAPSLGPAEHTGPTEDEWAMMDPQSAPPSSSTPLLKPVVPTEYAPQWPLSSSEQGSGPSSSRPCNSTPPLEFVLPTETEVRGMTGEQAGRVVEAWLNDHSAIRDDPQWLSLLAAGVQWNKRFRPKFGRLLSFLKRTRY